MRPNFYLAMLAVLTLVGYVSAQAAADSTIVATSGNDVVSIGDQWYIELHDNVSSDSRDTICPDSAHYYGPYRLAAADGEPMFKGFDLFAYDGCLASGDSLAIAYQIIHGDEVADTCATWTVIDTFTSTGSNGNYQDISSKVGNGLVVRAYNVDGTGIRIADRIRLVFKKTQTFYKKF